MNNTHVHTNGTGITLNGTSASVNMTLRDVIVDTNSVNGVVVTSGATHAGATVDRSTLAFNGVNGLAVVGTGSVALIGNSTVTGNGTGVAAAPGSTLLSFKNNQVAGNVSDGTPMTAFPGPGGTPLQ